jgi:hypothetical protein
MLLMVGSRAAISTEFWGQFQCFVSSGNLENILSVGDHLVKLCLEAA